MINLQLRCTLLLLGGLATVRCTFADEAVEFNRHIRPILSDNCFFCHGPDENHREADLRLDVEESAREDRGGYSAIVPGAPAESDVWSRIISDDPDLQMPPPDSHKSLKEEQKELLRRWIDQGAEWQGHWAFELPTRPAVPEVDSSSTHPIDQFIVQQQQRQGLTLSPEANRRTLIRRLSFDLTGLPASPEAVDAFRDSDEPASYEALVDRFLDSPHYGERMAVFWLDLVRYADTNGVHGDNPRPHSPYRDYVIQAFNDNMPFDRFTREQLAGDLLPDATHLQKIASGYNRLNPTTREGGAQPKEYIAKYAADRVRNASSVWLGITMECCQCHDHKFDPLTIREFYEFAAFFADLQETPVGVQSPSYLPVGAAHEEFEKLTAQLASLETQLNKQTPELDSAQAKWEASLELDDTDWVVLRPREAISIEQTTLKVLDDGSVISQGKLESKTDTYVINAPTTLKRITALRLEVISDSRLTLGGPGRADNGNFVLNELELRVGTERFAVNNASASFSQDGWDVAGAIDGDRQSGWAVMGQLGQDNVAVFRANLDNGDSDETLLTITLVQTHGTNHTLGRFRLSATAADDPPNAEKTGKVPFEIADIIRVASQDRNEAQRDRLAEYFRGIAPQLSTVRAAASQTRKRIDEINQQAAVVRAVAVEPRMMRVLPKGDWLNDSGDIVQPGVPASLPSLKVADRRATRLDLADWIVRSDQPLAARVLVNRLWRLMFGRAIVTSVDDFGAQGTWPSHPALLDWLAAELIDSGWNVKHMLRLMVTSKTYRQSSFVEESLQQSDPGNQWLARQGRFRLDAEAIRDNALAVSGLLVPTVGGQSVKPYQAPGYWYHLNFPRRVYKHDVGEKLYRRGLYTHWQRTFLHPGLAAFDAPNRERCTAKRTRSNTPLQALVLLNDPMYVEASRAFAQRMIGQATGSPEQMLRFAFGELLARAPTDRETTTLVTYYHDQLSQYRGNPEQASELISIGERPTPQDVDPAELAAWTSVARVLLNLHETITRY